MPANFPNDNGKIKFYYFGISYQFLINQNYHYLLKEKKKCKDKEIEKSNNLTDTVKNKNLGTNKTILSINIIKNNPTKKWRKNVVHQI